MGVQIPSLTPFFMKKTLSLLKKALRRTRDNFSFLQGQSFSWEEAEEALLLADFGPKFTQQLLNALRKEIGEEALGLKSALKVKIKEITSGLVPPDLSPPKIILVVGVNGSGKTTTCGKLALHLKGKGKVLLVAADTFRAAAKEQLQKLAKAAGVDFFSPEGHSDPAAVAYEASLKPYDYTIIDTAGRLHTKENLMREAVKIKKAVEKASGKEPLVLLVLDGTVGQNSLLQAQEFSKAMKVDALIITKLDGTAKGGAVFPIMDKLRIPVLFIGTGEGLDDLVPFETSSFLEAIFG